MTTIVKFVRYKDEFWPDAGEYVPLAEHLEIIAAPGLITEFELQSGEGTNVEIVGKEAGELWLIIDEDTLVKMIQLAFDVPGFTLAELIDAVQYNQKVITAQSKWPGE